jgi:hypothetical protein
MSKAEDIEQFWTWFDENEEALFELVSDDDPLFGELTSELGRIDGRLTFELHPRGANGKREFVLSADGNKELFPTVEQLYLNAPALERWTWVKFRPRRDRILDITAYGKTVKVDEVRFMLARDGKKVGIVLFLPDYEPNLDKEYGTIAFLFLEEALGEYAVETQVGFLQLRPHGAEHFAESAPLSELPQRFDAALAELKR